MTRLLELKEMFIDFYKINEKKVNIILKFVLNFIVIYKLNTFFSNSNIFSSNIFTVPLAIITAFISGSWFLLLLIIFIIIKISFLSIEMAVFTTILMIMSYILYISVFPKLSYVIILIPLLFSFKMIYLIPIITGLLFGPISILTVVLGVGIYYFGNTIPVLLNTVATTIEPTDSIVHIYNHFIDSIFNNKKFIITIVVFALVIVVTYFVSKLEFDYIWYIAIITGGIVNVLGLVLGSIFFVVDIHIIQVVFGTLFSILIACVIQFFRFSLDYERSEKVQFEDDDYYYYVKVIPKVKISKAIKEVKKIH
jgi:hypothetical protein